MTLNNRNHNRIVIVKQVLHSQSLCTINILLSVVVCTYELSQEGNIQSSCIVMYFEV